MNEAGYSVYAMDHRGSSPFENSPVGHGQSDGYRNYINSMRDVIGDACDFITFIHNSRPTLPVFVMVRLYVPAPQ